MSNPSPLSRYLNDDAYRAQCDAETKRQRKAINNGITRSLIASGNRYPANWTDAEKAEFEARELAKMEKEA